MDTFASASVKKFLLQHGCILVSEKNDHDIFMHDDVTVIQIHKTDRIDADLFDAIAVDQIGVAKWEVDYWLGENT